jgi:hypothetical protein
MSEDLTGGAALIAALESLPAFWPTDGPSNQLRRLMDGTSDYTLGDVLRLNLDRDFRHASRNTHNALQIGSGLWQQLEDIPASPLEQPDMLPDGW